MAVVQLTVASAPIDSAQFARSVREDTAELASYVLSDNKDKRNASFLARRSSASAHLDPDASVTQDGVDHTGDLRVPEEAIVEEDSESSSLETDVGPSVLSSMLRRSPPQSLGGPVGHDDIHDADHQGSLLLSPGASSRHEDPVPFRNGRDAAPSETSPLLGPKPRQPDTPSTNSEFGDIEGQKPQSRSFLARYFLPSWGKGDDKLQGITSAVHPKAWDKRVIWQRAVVDPARCVPSVIVGLLLNILDALSYGMYKASPMDPSLR